MGFAAFKVLGVLYRRFDIENKNFFCYSISQDIDDRHCRILPTFWGIVNSMVLVLSEILNSIANENKENFHHFDSQWRNKGDTRIIGYVPVQKRPDIACIFSVMSLFSVSAYSLLQGNLHDKAKQDQAPLNYAHLLSTSRFLKMGRKFEERLFSLYQRSILNNQAERFTFVIRNVFFRGNAITRFSLRRKNTFQNTNQKYIFISEKQQHKYATMPSMRPYILLPPFLFI